MINEKKVCGFFGLRENSKRLLGKNMLPIMGNPLSYHSIEKMKNSKYIDEICISTSSKNYKQIIEKWDVTIIDRPEELSEDNIPHLPVFLHAGEYLQEFLNFEDGDYFVFVDPTKIFTTLNQIEIVIETAYINKLDSCFTVKKAPKYNLIDAPAKQISDKENQWQEFGAVRLFTFDTLKKAELGTWGKGNNHLSLPIIGNNVIDIDTKEDFDLAKRILEK